MAKKDQARGGDQDAQHKLTHNPFAGLAGKRAELPAAEPAVVRPHAEASASTSTAVPESRTPRASAGERVKSRGRLVLRRETKHRGGKAVIVIQGLAAISELSGPGADALAKELKNKLGCGGTVERDAGETQIILQGDRAAKVAELLRERGFRVDGVTS